MKHPKESVLDEHSECLKIMRSCVADGFEEYLVQYAQFSAKHHARTRATIVHDHIVALAKERLLLLPHVHFLPKAMRNLFDVMGEMLFQFKKLSPKLLPSNYPTELALGFDEQENGLPGIPSNLPRFTVGYVPSNDWTSIAGIYVTYCIGKNLSWFRDITDFGGDTAVVPMQPVIDPPQATEKRVHAKGKRKKGGLNDAAAGV